MLAAIPIPPENRPGGQTSLEYFPRLGRSATLPAMRRSIILAVVMLLIAASGYALGQSLRGETEVRINARQLEDGRVEFALQQRAGGEWGERILPRSRMFPADPPVGQWLSSSAVALEGAGTTDWRHGSAEGQILWPTDGWQAFGDVGLVWYDVREESEGGQRTSLSSRLAFTGIDDLPQMSPNGPPPPALIIGCDDGQRSIAIDYVRTAPTTSIYGDEYYVATWRVIVQSDEQYAAGLDGDVLISGQDSWLVARVNRGSNENVGLEGTRQVLVDRPTQFYLDLRSPGASWVEITLLGDGQINEYSFEIWDRIDDVTVWDSPVQPNLDRCGDYDWDFSRGAGYTGNGH